MLQVMFEKHRIASGAEPGNVLCSLKSLLLGFLGFFYWWVVVFFIFCLSDFRKCFQWILTGCSIFLSVGMYVNVCLYLAFWDCFLDDFFHSFLELKIRKFISSFYNNGLTKLFWIQRSVVEVWVKRCFDTISGTSWSTAKPISSVGQMGANHQ